ncbi:hypothetical protein BDW22DRAFT_1486253 [Trametopsis cervina]|nr:hypothetical protein BDW22DRAFT_1486253 [Trametopsis cervina]
MYNHDRNVETQKPIGRSLAHPRRVLSAAFSPNGEQIVVGTGDGARAWKVSAGTGDAACEHNATSSSTGVLPYTDSSPMEEGWVLGPQDELLFWIAPEYRAALRKPGNTWVISARNLELDFSRLVHGKSWTDCRD